MEDKEFYMYCAYKALNVVTLALQIVFTSMWEGRFPGTVFSIEELNKISKKKTPRQNASKLHNVDVKKWDISKLAYVMVEADALDLQATGTDITVAINDTKRWRNEIVHKSRFACDKKEFEVYFGSFRNLVQVLESENYKKYSDNKNCQSYLRKVENFYHEDKPVFGEKLRKMKSEYDTMKMENMRYSIKEDYAKEKRIIECKLSELQEKNLELLNNIGEHVVENSEIHKELHKLKIENQNLVQTLRFETTEKERLREKLLVDKKKRKQLDLIIKILLLILCVAFMLFYPFMNNEYAAETDITLRNSHLAILLENNTILGNAVMKLTWENTELKRQNRKLSIENLKYLRKSRYVTEMREEINDLKKTARVVKILEEDKEKMSKVTEDQSVSIQNNTLTIEQQNEQIRGHDIENTYLGTQPELLINKNAEQKMKEERMIKIKEEPSNEIGNLNLRITRQGENIERFFKMEEQQKQTIAKQEKKILKQTQLLEEDVERCAKKMI